MTIPADVGTRDSITLLLPRSFDLDVNGRSIGLYTCDGGATSLVGGVDRILFDQISTETMRIHTYPVIIVLNQGLLVYDTVKEYVRVSLLFSAEVCLG